MRADRIRGTLAGVAAALLLAACGGGGDDTAPPPPSSYAVAAAERHWLTDTGSWAMTGTGSDGKTYNIAMAFAPLAPAPFPVGGAMAARSQQTFTVQTAGVPPSSGGPTVYFDASTLAISGLDYGDGTCSVPTSNTAVPASAAVGASGLIVSISDLDGCASTSTVLGGTYVSWSLESTSGVVLMCWNLLARDLAGVTLATESNCVEIAPDGTLGTKARFSISALGFTINARNF